ncbi:MAG: molecular chaperone DnaJ [Methanothrix sp.]|jgi:molecular chaperone DnaJ|uniref:molecular chaperone DnaJ n=1 Tax=Methanothrix sp. TaxID=90426 RepID=UPI001BD6AFCA|nr:molecular chaperone DnaJ [Methanothrix sp.]MBK7386055.1 molecular chaperone DnaJ [Methanothrix sp.]HPW73793.1 molecular chaperone DnaJ [Methanothrix sp.]
MPDKKDYYEVLGVSKDASEKDIKAAYRKLAMKHHPDRSDDPGAEERFKELSEAYAVLSDSDKRQKYDQFGHAGINSQYSQEDLFRGVNFEDLLRGFGMGGESIFDMFFGGGGGRRGPARGRDLRYDIELTLEQAAQGLEMTIEVPRTESCPKCQGSGAKPGTTPVTCSNCRGSGQVTRAQNTPFGQMVTSTTCPTCGGRGEIITSPCEDCSGSGRVRKSRKINIKVPAGVEDGQHLKLRGQGDSAGPKGVSGDLYVVINILPHRIFQRMDSDLIMESPISFTQAALGADLEVPTLNGRARIKVPAGTQTGTVFRLRGKGMPRLHGTGSGDLHVRVRINTPSALTARQKQLLEELAEEFGEQKRPAGEREKEKEKSLIDKIVDEVKSAVQ